MNFTCKYLLPMKGVCLRHQSVNVILVLQEIKWKSPKEQKFQYFLKNCKLITVRVYWSQDNLHDVISESRTHLFYHLTFNSFPLAFLCGCYETLEPNAQWIKAGYFSDLGTFHTKEQKLPQGKLPLSVTTA